MSDPHAGIMDAEAVMEALMAKRGELDLAAPEKERDFRVILRGGAWLLKHKGLEYDSVRAEAVGGDAQRWCVMGGLPKSFTASLEGHGDGVAMMLCHAWVAKMQHLYDAFQRDSVEGWCDKASHEFVEDPVVQDSYAVCTPAVRKRIDQIRALRWAM